MEPSNTTAPMPAKKSSSGKKTIGLIVAAFFGIIILGLVLALAGLFSSGSGTAATAEAFIFSMADGDVDAAYAMTSSEFQSITTQADMEAFLGQYPVVANATDVSFTTRGFENDVKYVAGTLYAGEETSPIYVEVIKEDGENKILYFSVNQADQP